MTTSLVPPRGRLHVADPPVAVPSCIRGVGRARIGRCRTDCFRVSEDADLRRIASELSVGETPEGRVARDTLSRLRSSTLDRHIVERKSRLRALDPEQGRSGVRRFVRRVAGVGEAEAITHFTGVVMADAEAAEGKGDLLERIQQLRQRRAGNASRCAGSDRRTRPGRARGRGRTGRERASRSGNVKKSVLKILKEEDAETADSIRLYLREIGRVPLLTAADEVSLAQRMEGGIEAEEKLGKSNGKVSETERWTSSSSRSATVTSRRTI